MIDGRKRLLITDIGAPFGGAEAYVVSLAEMLKSEAQLFAVCGLPELAARLRSLNVRVFCIPIVVSPKGNLILFNLCNLSRLILATLLVPFLILRYRIDVIQINGFYESLLVLPARLLGCYTIRTSHSSSEVELYRWYRHPTKYFPRLAALYLLKWASRIVCVSEAVGRDVLRSVSPAKVVVIPNWIAKMPSTTLQADTLNAPVNLLYVGRLERYKGLHLLLEAMRGLNGVRLTVLGVGSYREELERLAEGLDVRFEGFCSNTAPFYQDADIFINPSLGPEGLPIVSLESMAHGLPCIFSALPVHREISNDGTATLLFETGDAVALRARLSQLVADPELRLRLSRNARAVVQERYSPDSARKAYLSAFRLRGAY